MKTFSVSTGTDPGVARISFGRSPSIRLRIAQMRAVSDNNLCRQTSPTNILFYLLKRVKKNIDGRKLLQSFKHST